MRTRAWRSWVTAAAAFSAACGVGVGCGGDDSNIESAGTDGGADVVTPRLDSGRDTTTGDDSSLPADAGNDSAELVDAGNDAGNLVDASGDVASDSSAVDASGDAAAACSPASSACSGGGVTSGLCKSSVCVACTDTTDDALCAAAYADGGAFICKAGSCVSGNCHSSSTCSGNVCASNACAACTTDSQCKNDPAYGSSFVCNTTLGTCVSSACSTPNTACTVNAADECCAVSNANVCVAGNCCTNAQCAPGAPACQSNTCTQCDAVANNTYTVDPVNGSDTLGNGSGSAGGAAAAVCAFKTITKALAVIGANPPANTKINVVGPSTVQAGETFPIVVPVNVTIAGVTGAVTVSVPIAATGGFRLRAGSSGIANLIVDGTGNTATARGIQVETGSQASTAITGVEVRSFPEAGIRVQDTGVVTIGPGTNVHNSGSTGASRPGLHVTGAGTAIIASSAAAISFHDNSFAGIGVDNGGSVMITGTPGVGQAGTVVTYSNIGPGIVIAGVPNAGQYPTQSALTGLVSYSNTGDGARFLGGSNVKVRGSRFYTNLVGVTVSQAGSGALSYNDDVSHIDLGSNASSDPGSNVIQSPALLDAGAVLANANAGLCLSIAANKSQTLLAAGNRWASSTNTVLDCALASPGTLSKSSTCSAGVDLGGNGQTGNTVTIANCN
jgi:hypothetical protein